MVRPRQRARRGTLALAAALFCATVNCYDTGDGSEPPLDRFYYPVGLKVSAGGSALYVVNSDFDLQYNGGTLQSYDLLAIRRDVLKIIENPRAPDVPLVRRSADTSNPCPDRPPVLKENGDGKQPIGETCAPPVDSRAYVKDSVITGAFATELLLSPPVPGRSFDRLFFPIRGSASLTWANVVRDDPNAAPARNLTKADYAPWRVDCGQRDDRCSGANEAGRNPDEFGNTRHFTMPGEPFGSAFSEDASTIVVTHQNETKASLFSTGLGPTSSPADRPALLHVADEIPVGGIGVAAVPHDKDALAGATPRNPAWLLTSRSVAEITLLRFWADDGSSLARPFLDKETAYPVQVNAGGFDSRGIVIDPTPRIACKAKVAAADPLKGRSDADVQADVVACARKPARVFIANRAPATLLVGELGVTNTKGEYDPDVLVLKDAIPLSAGPSRVYLAPVVERDGRYGLRVFAVCFDSATIFVFDPNINAVEQVIRLSPGPFAMAFDPFDLEAVAKNEPVPLDPRVPEVPLRRYRFAYVASFLNSFVQVIDLDNAQARRDTFERVVFSLGEPTFPKGS